MPKLEIVQVAVTHFPKNTHSLPLSHLERGSPFNLEIVTVEGTDKVITENLHALRDSDLLVFEDKVYPGMFLPADYDVRAKILYRARSPLWLIQLIGHFAQNTHEEGLDWMRQNLSILNLNDPYPNETLDFDMFGAWKTLLAEGRRLLQDAHPHRCVHFTTLWEEKSNREIKHEKLSIQKVEYGYIGRLDEAKLRDALVIAEQPEAEAAHE